MKFLGFRRPDGKVGIRNHVLVLATVGCAAEAARQTADGIYGPATAEAVREFQDVFGLPRTGITGYPTWYKISEIYVGVSRIAELT